MNMIAQRPYAIVPCEKGSLEERRQHYEDRAEELRTIADELVHRECQDMLVRLANTYDDMAVRLGSCH